MLLYYWNKLIKKLRGKAIKNSIIHPTSKIEAGSQVINSTFSKYTFCGYDCKIINCHIGSFCSIADFVCIGGVEHPISWVSTSPVFYKGKDSIKKKFSEHIRPKDKITVIGNDVWIGERAIIKAGVNIGNGAVIGMGSVVTHNVLPYTIVAGNPAKLIRYRFEEDIYNKLANTEWWNMTENELSHYAYLFTEPDKFLEIARKK